MYRRSTEMREKPAAGAPIARRRRPGRRSTPADRRTSSRTPCADDRLLPRPADGGPARCRPGCGWVLDARPGRHLRSVVRCAAVRNRDRLGEPAPRPRPQQGGVGTVRSAGQDEQRHSVGVEDQGVRDGPNIAAELFCSRGRARCRMRKQHHPTRHSCGGEDLCDAADVGVIRAGGGPDAHGGERRRAVGHRTRHVVGDG